ANVAMIAVGWGVFTWIVPAYAGSELGVGPRLIGLLLLANACTVVLAQIPVTRRVEGRRRTVTMAVAALLFVAACGVVVGASLVGPRAAYAALLAAAFVAALRHCFHTPLPIPPL